MGVRVQSAPFSPGTELDAFTKAQTGAGAVVSFSGIVRDEAGTLTGLEIEHYPGMTESALAAIEAEARERWPLSGVLVIHRTGG